MSFRQLVYVSSARQGYLIHEVDQQTEAGHARNAQNDITGILLHYNGNFLQLLEGAPGIVDTTLGRIKADQRHRGLLVLYDETVDARRFSDSSTALLVNDHNAKTSLPDLFEESGSSWVLRANADIDQKLGVLLNTFLAVNSGSNI